MDTKKKWNIIYGHKWTDKVYDMALSFLSNKPILFRDNRQKRIFESRMQWYSLSDNKLVHVTNESPQWMNFCNIAPNHTNIYTVIKESEIDNVLNKLMSDPLNTALGTHTLYDKVIRNYYLGISRQNVQDFLKKDNSLQIHNNTGKKPIISSFRPEYPMQHWQMDITHLDRPVIVKENKNYKYILVIIDIFSKYVYMFPLKEKSSENIAKWLMKIFLSGDIPMVLHSDNAQEFTSEIVNNVCIQFNVIQKNGSVYSPQTQGFVENKNKHIKNLLNYYFIKYNTYKYYDIIDRVCFTINNTKHSVTGHTPLQIHRGRNAFLTNQYTYIGNVDEIKLQKNEKYEYEKYFEKALQLDENIILQTKSRIDNVANKREEKEGEKRKEFRINNPVKIFSYIKQNNEITAIQIRLKRLDRDEIEYKILKNPLTIKKVSSENDTRRIHVNTIDAKPETMYQKIDKKRYKVFEDIFKIKHKESKSSIIEYKLTTLDEKWIVERMVNKYKSMWTPVFYASHLLEYVIDHSKKSIENKFFIDPFDNDGWYSGKEKKIVSRQIHDPKPTKRQKKTNIVKNLQILDKKDIYREFYDDDSESSSSIYRAKLHFIERTKNTEDGIVKDWYKAVQYDDNNFETITREEIFDKNQHITIQPSEEIDTFTDNELKYLFSTIKNWNDIPIVYVFTPNERQMNRMNVSLQRATILEYSEHEYRTRGKRRYPFLIQINSKLKPSSNKTLSVELKYNMYNKMKEINGWKFDGEDVILYLKDVLKNMKS